MIRFTFPSHRSGDGWRAQAVSADYVFVLDASGRIDRLDLRTLDYAGLAGRLSSPVPPIGSTWTSRPIDLAAYGVYGFEVARGDSPEQVDEISPVQTEETGSPANGV